MAIISKRTPASPETQELKLLPSANWSAMHGSAHFVQFYETDELLAHAVGDYVSAGLAKGDTCVVIATQAHRDRLEARLQADGLNLTAARTRGAYFSQDAAATLSQFMVDGCPEAERFTAIVGSIVERAATGGRHVRVFGEMVALLWAAGNRFAAVCLEELWNELHNTSPVFSLCCAYPMRGFAREVYGAPFLEICQQHALVLPDEC